MSVTIHFISAMKVTVLQLTSILTSTIFKIDTDGLNRVAWVTVDMSRLITSPATCDRTVVV